MMRTLAKAYAYRKAPRTTFTVLHPKQAVKLRRLRWDIRHAYAPRLAALGALAVAIPFGYALGRKAGNGNGSRSD
jgi:hypothetical protein